MSTILTRRGLLAAFVAVAVSPMVGCDGGDDEDGLAAWAGKIPDSVRFRQSVAWVEPNDLGGRTVAMAFVPFDLDAGQRRAIVSNEGVYPVLPDKAPMLEARLVMAKPEAAQAMGVGTLRRIKLTFWNFAEPTPVVVIERKDWKSTSDLQIEGLDGNFVPGGWLDGTIRGRYVLKDEGRRDAYVWNLQVAMSLE